MKSAPDRTVRTPAVLLADEAGARGPEPRKRLRIVDWVRNEIAEGRCRAADPLPDRAWFERKFRATRVTVQRAFDQLAREGFVVAIRRRGTFPAERPPFRGRYLLALSGTEDAPADDMISKALLEAAKEVAAKRGVRFETAYVLDEGPDSERYENLLADLRRQRWSGVFLRALSSNRGLRTIGNVDHVPVAGLFSADPRARGSLVRPLSSETEQGIHDACRRLFAKCVRAGCRSVFVLSTAIGSDEEASIRALAGQMGLRIGPDGYQTAWIDSGHLLQVRRLLRLVFRAAGESLPDAIVLLDDNFVPVLEEVLRERFGTKPPRKIFLAACGNRPVLPETEFPVEFCGLDMARTLDGFVAWAEAIHAGIPTADPRLIGF